MEKKLFPNKIIQIIGLFLISLLFGIPLFVFGINSFGFNSFGTSDLFKTILYLIGCISFIVITYVINYRNKQRIKLNFNIVNFYLLGLMLILLFVFSIGINSPVNRIINQLFSDHELSTHAPGRLIVIGSIILAPFFEEIIFRGIILQGLLTRYAPKYAIIISALLFGFVHGQPIQIWGAFVIGLIFGWIYYNTNSLGTTIILHFFLNLINNIKNILITNYLASESLKLVYILIVIISVPLFIVILKKLLQEIKTYNYRE